MAVANRLRPVLLKLARELRRESHGLGVTGGQVTLLVQIKTHPGISARELAARERVSPAGISGHLDRLERAGLVMRMQDAADRRRQVLALTPEGDRVLRAVKRRRTAWLAERMKGMTPDELAAIDAALAPLMKLVEEAE